MKTRVLVALALLLSGIGTAGVVLACGDKFLLPSRGTRFQQAPPDRAAAAVLLYANPASALPAALTKLSVDAALRKVGYRPTMVSSLDALERALTQGGWDVIVVDLADSGSIRSRGQGRPAPVVVPVAQNASSEQVAAARKQYGHVLKSPSRSQAFVEAIDDALADWQASAGRQKSR
jgi:CheY-like chemotaxis protein